MQWQACDHDRFQRKPCPQPLSLLSKGLNAFDAATLAIFINGLAGDEAYLEKGYGFGATDVVAHIGKVIKG